MIAPGLGVIALGHWQATEFAAPEHEHIIKQPTLTQVAQERGAGLIALRQAAGSEVLMLLWLSHIWPRG